MERTVFRAWTAGLIGGLLVAHWVVDPSLVLWVPIAAVCILALLFEVGLVLMPDKGDETITLCTCTGTLVAAVCCSVGSMFSSDDWLATLTSLWALSVCVASVPVGLSCAWELYTHPQVAYLFVGHPSFEKK